MAQGLCNLSCRTCGHIFSSSWYQDQAKLAGPAWKKANKVLNYAGRFETDAWDQLVDHIEHVEQIYFAGGEPLLMEEHYKILDELVRRKKFDVRLIYNTNFTHTDLKGRSVFEYWKQFDSVSVGASLDASGEYGEYIRKGTDWAVVEQNRRDMMAICPRVDFYISPTLSIMNAMHLPWLEPQDNLGRATQGFRSAITFMNTTDNTHLIPKFWEKTCQLDEIRKENILDIIPELKELK